MEPVRNSIVVNIDEPTKVASARRAAGDLCRQLALPEETLARAELVAVELANNLLQHAGSGQLFFSPHPTPGGAPECIEIISVDCGPGIPSVQRAMTDGYSTRNTPGIGLGAVQRKARHFELFSAPGKGTVAAALIGAPINHASGSTQANGFASGSTSRSWTDSVLSAPLLGESANGDSWAIHTGPRRTTYLLADGLGHGPFAAEASSMATAIFLDQLERDPSTSLTELIEQMHLPLHATRGAAISLFAVDHPIDHPIDHPTDHSTSGDASTLTAVGCGVGNVSCLLQNPDGTTRSLASHNGTVGHQMRRIQEFPFTLTAGTVLVLHSDGLSTHWKLAQYPGIVHCSPAVIAGTLFRDAARPRDDATVLVARLDALPVRSAHA